MIIVIGYSDQNIIALGWFSSSDLPAFYIIMFTIMFTMLPFVG